MTKSKESLGTLFQDIARLRVFCFNNMLKDLELTATQSWVLSALMQKEGIIQGDLAQTLGNILQYSLTKITYPCHMPPKKSIYVNRVSQTLLRCFISRQRNGI